MAISSQGIGSGLDVNAIVTQLGAIERQSLKPLQAQANSLQTQLSTYGKLKSQASALADAAADLALPGAWSAPKATSSNAAAVDVKVASGASASSLSVQVAQLARGQSSATLAQPTGALMGAEGSLTIALGTWEDGASERNFVADSSKNAITIDVSSTDTLASLAEKINASAAGVTASVLKDGNTERLLMRSASSGTSSGFSVSTSAVTGSLDQFNLASPVSKTASEASTSGMFMSQTAQNAQFSINGISVSALTNTVNDVVPGVTLRLNQVTSNPVEIGITNDLDAVKGKIKSVVDAFNALNQTMNDATKYDAASKKGGPLQGDSMTVSIESALRGLLRSSSSGSSSYSMLYQVGIDTQKDGTLQMNDTKMTEALSNLSEVRKLFVADNNTPQTNGFALKIRDFARGLIGFDGRITTRTTGIEKSITNNQADQDRVNERADRVEAALRKQYSALDTKMSQMGGLTSFVSSQIALWNKSSG